MKNIIFKLLIFIISKCFCFAEEEINRKSFEFLNILSNSCHLHIYFLRETLSWNVQNKIFENTKLSTKYFEILDGNFNIKYLPIGRHIILQFDKIYFYCFRCQEIFTLIDAKNLNKLDQNLRNIFQRGNSFIQFVTRPGGKGHVKCVKMTDALFFISNE